MSSPVAVKPQRMPAILTEYFRDNLRSPSPPPSSPLDTLVTHGASAVAPAPAPAPTQPILDLPFRPRSRHAGDAHSIATFNIKEQLGTGAFSVVHRAVEVNGGFEVAIKIITLNGTGAEKPVTVRKGELEREIAILRYLDHPNIMRLYDAFVTENRVYLVLEYLAGGELFDYVEAGRLTPAKTLACMAQAIRAVQYCHDRGIVHRDVALENLLLDKDGNVKLSDFGFARRVTDKPMSTHCGKIYYIAPEVQARRPYDGRQADVFSLGVCFYACVVGDFPFPADKKMLTNKLSGKYTAPRSVLPGAAHLIAQMLQADPEKRIALSAIADHPCFRNTGLFGPLPAAATVPRPPSAPAAAVTAPRPSAPSAPSVEPLDKHVIADICALSLSDVESSSDEEEETVRQRVVRRVSLDRTSPEHHLYTGMMHARHERLQMLHQITPRPVSPT